MIKVNQSSPQTIGIRQLSQAAVKIHQQGEHFPRYNGTLTVTPSDHTQTLSTAGCVLNGDVIINPIPNNYGRIGWNGVTLSVY